MKKVVAIAVASLALLASNALSEEMVNLKCKWVAGKKLENQVRLVEGEEFDFPVSPEKGFFYYLENGMTKEQKKAISEAGKKFLEKLKSKKENTSMGILCRDTDTNEKVLILYSKQ